MPLLDQILVHIQSSATGMGIVAKNPIQFYFYSTFNLDQPEVTDVREKKKTP